MRRDARAASLRAVRAIASACCVVAATLRVMWRAHGFDFARARTLARRGAAAARATFRRRPDAVIAAALLLGVLLMILHWKGTITAIGAAQREAPPQQQHAAAGP